MGVERRRISTEKIFVNEKIRSQDGPGVAVDEGCLPLVNSGRGMGWFFYKWENSGARASGPIKL